MSGSDALWYGADGGTGDLTGFARVTQSNFVSSTWELVGDFDGDGREDIFWYGPGTFPSGGQLADAVWYGQEPLQ
jgi:hypothetical protein